MIQINKFLINSFVLLSMFLLPTTSYADTTKCLVNADWLSSPSLPIEVTKSEDGGKSSSFCDFYQFSTQTYLYLMSPSAPGSSIRNFQVAANFPLLEFNSDGTPADSCDEIVQGSTLRTGLNKSSLSTEQAGGGATIYAQDGNVIYYDVRFNKTLCNQTASAVEMYENTQINFPAGTTELKFAWKKLSTAEITSKTFVTQTQTVSGEAITLGLVGVHIVRATEDHPEFVWSTYEHKINTPNCTPSSPPTTVTTDWTFASKACVAALPGSAEESACEFNEPQKNLNSPEGASTNICRVYPYGTASGDSNATTNISDIQQQNANMLALFNQPTTPASMQVLKNYFNVGALWVSDTTQSSGGVGVPNERGSLRLANSVAETDYQHVNLTSKTFISNCFGCHNYKGSSQYPSNNITSQNLSHIFKDIKFGQNLAIDVTATNAEGVPVMVDSDTALGICRSTCSNLTNYNGYKPNWNGDWTNLNASAGYVCGCTLE